MALCALTLGVFTQSQLAGASPFGPAGNPALAPLPAITAAAIASETTVVTADEPIPHGTQEQIAPTVKSGTSLVVQEGAPGVARVSYVVTTINGVEVDRFPSISVIVSPPIDQIIAVGTLSVPAATDVEKGTNRELGQQMAADLYGWTDDEWLCLDELWKRESGWSHTSMNTSSGAYGIPQALPGDKMAAFGADWQTNPATQIAWGLSYVKGRYQTPCGAWAHFTKKNWY